MQGGKLRIFISHRHDDLTICQRIKNILAERAAGKIEFLFAPEKITDGEEWYRWIKDNAPNADIFLFVYTKPSLCWDWALFETGMFEAIRSTLKKNAHAFVCLHAPEVDVPEPIKALQTRPATPEKVEQWLRWLFGETLPGMTEPINADYAAGESIAVEAATISELITKQAMDALDIEERLNTALIPVEQRILRNGLRLAFFFRWCVAEPRLSRLRFCDDGDRFRAITGELARDLAWVHAQGEQDNVAFLGLLKDNLSEEQYQQILVVFGRWRHHAGQLLLAIERDSDAKDRREVIVGSLERLLGLNRFFTAVFATAMTELVSRHKPRFEDISDGVEINQRPAA